MHPFANASDVQPGYGCIAMLGPAPGAAEQAGAIAAAYQAGGLFERWPIEYIALDADGPLLRRAVFGLRALLVLAALILRHRRVLVHVHSDAGTRFWRSAAFIALARLCGCAHIVQLHGGRLEHLRGRTTRSRGLATRERVTVLRARLLGAALDRAACVIASTGRMRGSIARITSNERIVCIPCPAPELRVDASSEAARERPPSRVLFMGSLAADGGACEMLEAFARLRERIPGLQLEIAGKGDPHAALAYACRLGIADAVRFTGWLGPDERRAALGRAAVFVLASQSAGLPPALLEAMALGVPVLASAAGGVPDAVVDGVTGFLVAPGDAATLARLLERLLGDRRIASRLARAARESVRLRFSTERVLARLEALYAELGVLERADDEPDAHAARLPEAA